MSTKKKIRSPRRWMPEDDHLLCQVVAQHTSPVGRISWASVAPSFPGRQVTRCRERWCNVLDPMVNRGPWTPEEDRKIVELYQELGCYKNKWVVIAERLGTGRTGDNLKGHAAKLLKNNNLSNLEQKTSKAKSGAGTGSRDIRHYFGLPGINTAGKKPSTAAMLPVAVVSDDETSATILRGQGHACPLHSRTMPRKSKSCKAVAVAPKLPQKRNKRVKKAISPEAERKMLLAAMKVDPRAEVEDQNDLRAGWRKQERLRAKKLWFPTGGWKAPLWNVMEACEAITSKATLCAKESKVTKAERNMAKAIKEAEIARLEEKLFDQDADTVVDSDHLLWAIEYLKQKNLKKRPSQESPATTVANLIETHMPAGPMLMEGHHEEELSEANRNELHREDYTELVVPVDLSGTGWREREGTSDQTCGEGGDGQDSADADISYAEIGDQVSHDSPPSIMANLMPGSQVEPLHFQDRKRKRNDDAGDCGGNSLPQQKKALSAKRAANTLKLQDVRYPTFVRPCDALLIRAHAAMYELLPKGDCESISVLRMAASYYKYWRPQEGQTKVVLLAESHGFTTKEGAGLDPNLLPEYDGPRGFIPLVYSFGYGESEALSRLPEDINPPTNSGTSQFWTLLTACSRDTTTVPATVMDPNKMASPFAADVLKGGRLSVEERLKAKLAVLEDLQRRGIWLLDASIFGWYVSQAQQYTRSKETGEVHRTQKTRPPKHLKGPALVLAWEMFTKHLVHEVAQEGGLKTVVTIGKDVERLVTHERIQEAAGSNCTIESWPAPNAWVEGGYSPWHHKLSKLMRKLAPPLPAAGTIQHPISI